MAIAETVNSHDAQETVEKEANETIGVVGLGFLGRGIATCFLAHGFRVVGCDQDLATRNNAHRHIETGLQELIERASFPAQIIRNWRDRYTEAHLTEAFADCIFVIETVTEDRAAKQAVFDQIEAVVSAITPIASNTSTLQISNLQAECKRPDRILGMHWAEPAHITRFMEIVAGEQTSNVTVYAAERLARRIGKDPCLLNTDIPGFIVNRIGYAIYREAAHLLEIGIEADTIDRAFRNAVGLWAACCGPLRWIDLTGGPALYAKALERLIPDLCSSPELPQIFRQMNEADARGVINGRGFYSYTTEEAKQWEEMFHTHVWKVQEEMEQQFPLPAVPDEQPIT